MTRKKTFFVTIAVLALVVLLMMIVAGRSRSSAVPKPADTVLSADPVSSTESAEPSEAKDEPVRPSEPAEPSPAEPGRQDGERFEDIIILEGMEETVCYEHIQNNPLGFEMDYDYEKFVRHSEPDREIFVSCWDDPDDPENYLEVRYSPLDAEAAAAEIGEMLSNDYEIRRDDLFPLERAGICIRIAADEIRGGGYMPDHLQTVYIIPASDGCRVAAAHCATVESEGFLRRFRYMMNTFSAVTGQESIPIPGTWQTASVEYSDDGAMQPAYYVRFTDADILYGHLKDGLFVLDHFDKIVSFEETVFGGHSVQAQASNGAPYTYRTSESDENVLEYYETWREEDFPEAYRGGASLSRCG